MSDAPTPDFCPDADPTRAHGEGGFDVSRTAPQSAPPPDPTVRDDLPGFELLEEIGRGGMGVVYRARETGLDRVVAVKLIRGEAGDGSAELARFLAEAQAAAGVRHPHVVGVYRLGEHTGRPFLALEYCPGGSLADRLRAGRPDLRAGVEILRQVATGVGAAHAAGVVHRDLKPGNVLFDAAGLAKVADFGLAKRAAHDLTNTVAVMGTPAYMAPEQADGKAKSVGPPADVWAVGVMLYECLTGARPFTADDALSLLYRIRHDTPVRPRHLVPGIPADLEQVCLRCLEKRPADRYPNGAALAAELERWLTGKPVQARSRQVALIAGLAVAAVFAAGVGLPPVVREWNNGRAAVVATQPVVEPQPKPTEKPRATFPFPDPPPRTLPPPPGIAGPIPPPPGSAAALLLSPENEWGPPRRVMGVNTTEKELTPTLTADEREIVFVRTAMLYHGRRDGRDGPFVDVIPLPEAVNRYLPLFAPSLSGDGLMLFFHGRFAPITHSAHFRICTSSRSARDAAFTEPVALKADGSLGETMPVLSADGRRLLLTIHPKADGASVESGSLAQLVRSSPAVPFTGWPEVLSGVNAKETDAASWLSPDGTALLATTSAGFSETQMLYVRPTPDASFGPGRVFDPFPGRLRVGRPWLSPDGRRMYFHARDETASTEMYDHDLWVSELRPKVK